MNISELFQRLELPDLSPLNEWLYTALGDHPAFFGRSFQVLRIFSIVLAVLVVCRCMRSLLRGKIEPETWAYLGLSTGERCPVRHWENVVGRARSSDIVIGMPTVSRSHAALIRAEDGTWQVLDLGSKSGTLLNGTPVGEKTPLNDGDVLTIGGVEAVFTLVPANGQQENDASRTKPGKSVRPSTTLYLLTLFLLFILIQLVCSLGFTWPVILSFAVLGLSMWIYFAVFRMLRRRGFEIETLCFFLTALGFSVASSSSPDAPVKQTVSFLIGLSLFVLLCWCLRDLKRATVLRWPMAASALVLLGLNMLFGETAYGARNWLTVAGFTFQPSELVKIAFIYAGGATLDRLFARRNVFMFIAFTGACIGALALMGDFGTAAIFFVAFLVIVYLRSGDIATIALVCSVVVLGCFVILTVKPYIANRFAVWGHVWEYAHSSGYQQTRTMSAAASGGLIGFGPGNGWLKGIAAADTDLVFGMLCEEHGLVVALSAVAAIAALALFSIKTASAGRSSFYVICACSASSMLLFQMMLNIFGSVDILPLTGVTFPFVSNGGTSLIACWAMLAFIKAADTRQNASFAVKLRRRVKSPDARLTSPLQPPADPQANTKACGESDDNAGKGEEGIAPGSDGESDRVTDSETDTGQTVVLRDRASYGSLSSEEVEPREED